MTKQFDLKDIAQGSLVGEIREKTVEFKHNGELCSVDIRIKQLPYSTTEPLFNRLNKGEDVVAEWISAALVDDEGNTYLTKKQVGSNFTQALAAAVFNVVIGLEKAPKDEEGKSD